MWCGVVQVCCGRGIIFGSGGLGRLSLGPRRRTLIDRVPRGTVAFKVATVAGAKDSECLVFTFETQKRPKVSLWYPSMRLCLAACCYPAVKQ